jgi:predicted secreted Zn-dependent protease
MISLQRSHICKTHVSLRETCGLAVGVWLVFQPALAAAASQAHWSTNYYQVTGSSLKEIRQSIAREKPRKLTHQALTEWNVRARFAAAKLQGEYRCSGFTTTTTIRITLPRWTPAEDTPDEVVKAWTRYIDALREHEVGHGQIAEAAAQELHRRVAELGTEPHPDQLTSKVEALVHETLSEFKEHDRNYDRLTEHGITQGAVLSVRGKRAEHSSKNTGTGDPQAETPTPDS